MHFKSSIFHPNSEFRDPGFVPISPLSSYSFSSALLLVHCPLFRHLPDCSGAQVYENGEVCISILHPPEEDKYGYESVAERWSPVQTPETILLSVISMLRSPNDGSPANVEAARLWREDAREFRRRCRANVRASLGDE